MNYRSSDGTRNIVQFEGPFYNDPKISAASSHSSQQVFVVVIIRRRDQLARRKDNLCLDNSITTVSSLTSKISSSTRHGKTRDSRIGIGARGEAESCTFQRVMSLPDFGTTFYRNSLGIRVYRHAS